MPARLRQETSRRERQVLDAVYARKTASAAEVRGLIPRPPSYSAVRATLSVLVRKGLLSYRRVGRRYVYAPTIPNERARASALHHLLETYFDGSVNAVVAALVRIDRARLSQKDYRSLTELIKKMEKVDRHAGDTG